MASLRFPLLALLVLSSAALAGCAGDAPASEPEPEADTDAMPAPAEVPPEPSMSWEMMTYRGDFATTSAFSVTALIAEHPVEVPEGTQLAFFNGSIAGAVPDETVARLVAEDCSADLCEVEATTSGGRFSIALQEPSPGDWILTLLAGTAAQAGSWSVTVDALVEAQEEEEEE